jgi:gamma-glutamyltranspeptidase/glutathione hydrolase
MNPAHRLLLWSGLTLAFMAGAQPTPVTVRPVTARHGMVVAGHPQAAEAGLAVLQAGGNAIDAAIATSLALGVAEPYASGLGGKLMLLYYNAATGRTQVVDAMDAAGSVDVPAYLQRPEQDRSYGYGAVCVPGLAAGLWLAHQKWGARPWADDVQPAIALARAGFQVLPKSRDFFEEQVKKLRRGDAEIARLYLPDGKLPETGSRLPNPDLARTLVQLAQHGRDGFYRGPVAKALIAAMAKGGGLVTAGDLASYEARLTEPVGIDFHGDRIQAAPPPSNGSAMFLPALKALEDESFGAGPLRTASNLDLLGRVWRVVEPDSYRLIGDAPESTFHFEKLIAPDAIQALRARARLNLRSRPAAAADRPFYESAMAATTHFIVVDARGDIVCATQSLSVHFGAGVVPPGTGVVLNNSMSNFEFTGRGHVNFLAPGRRPRSTISPTLVLRHGKPLLALGVPGSARIPTAMLQVLIDRLVLHRPLADAIGDTRFHFMIPWKQGDVDTFEAEDSFPATQADALRALGWKVSLSEPAGRGRRFSGVNAVEFNPDGSLTGYADPRRTNAAAGY